MGKECSMPTKDNPMGNVLMSDYVDRPDRPQVVSLPNRKNTSKQFPYR